jgi:diacylglycerol kinase
MNFLNKFKVAFEGLFYLVNKDRNFQIHLILFSVLLIFATYFNVSKIEWLAILICSSIVFSLEALNSALEKLADFTHIEKNSKIKLIKDISAAAVLISCIFSCIVAGIIFIPKFNI